jgi:hypothetical protein
MLYTTEYIKPTKHVFPLLVRIELTSSSLQLDVILYTTEALQNIKYACLLLVRFELISSSL